jgi:hypothetical protein
MASTQAAVYKGDAQIILTRQDLLAVVTGQQTPTTPRRRAG